MPFGKTGSKQKASSVNLGTIGSFRSLQRPKEREDGTVSPYVYNNVELKPTNGGVKAKLRLMYDPSWYRAAFASEKSFKEAIAEWAAANPKPDGEPASTFVFEKNISSKTKDSQSFLEGLCGTPEAWEELQGLLCATVEPLTAEAASELLQQFFATLGPVPVFYLLRQEKRDNVLTEFFEVDEIRHVTESNLKYFVSKATKAADAIAEGKKDRNGNLPAPIVFNVGIPEDLGLDTPLPAEEIPTWVAV